MKNKKVKKEETAGSVEQSSTAENGALRQQCPTVTGGEFKTLPRAELRPDPNQPRKVFDDAKLAELADSIAAQGILQPILVRWIGPEVKLLEPDLTNTNWRVVKLPSNEVELETEHEGPARLTSHGRTEGFYQIVDGERRWRAANIAGLDAVPCLVREMDARQVENAQWTANQVQENLTALEEARAFAGAIAERRKTNPGFSADDYAKELGVARATVYNRLTLTRLTPAVHDAVAAGKIEVTVAGLVAMIPDPKQQEKLLAKITNEEDWEFPFSFREVQELIEEEYCKQLKDAPFDLEAEMENNRRIEENGDIHWTGPCKTCPKRSGNMKEAFPQIKNLNVCTDPACYQGKVRSHFKAEAQAAERKGLKVLTQKEFKKVKKDYVAANEYDYQLGGYSSWGDLMGKKRPDPVMVVTDEGLKAVYPRELAIEAAKKNGAKLNEPKSDEERQAEEKERAEQHERYERRRGLVVELAPELLKCLGKLSDKLAWELASEMIGHIDWPDSNLESALMDEAKGAKAIVLAKCFADQESNPVEREGKWHQDNVARWKRAGVDLIDEESKREKEADKALPLEKAKPKQKELLAVKKNKKKKK